MHYVKQSLGENEELIHGAQFHWMYNFSAMMNIVFGIILSAVVIGVAIKFEPMIFKTPGFEQMGLLQQIRALHPGVKIVALIVFLLGILKFAQMMIVKVTTEIAITNKRLIYKRGLVARHVGEIAIDRIEGVNVLQGMLGRMFNYGRVMVRGMGVGEIVLPPIDEPVRFRKAIDKARSL